MFVFEFTDMDHIDATIITIGDELLIGQTIDTNSAYIGQELNKIGIWVKRRIAVGDIREEILKALSEQSKDNKVIIITGGLGPTADDITKPALCDYFNSKLIVNEGALENVKNIFTRLNRPLIERNLKQAEVPDKCTFLPNLRGTAPGMWFEKDNVIYVSLPGVPHEMKGLIQNSVITKLKEQLTLPAVVHKTLLVAGKGESEIAELIQDFENSLPENIKLAYLPGYGIVRLRLTGRSNNKAAIEQEVNNQFEQLKPLVKQWLIAESDVPLEFAVNQILKENKKMVATAESCTGGYIAHLITSIPGSSNIYIGSVVSYANQVKENLLGVQSTTLEKFGAVSEQTVNEMVQGVLKTMGADYAVATSGIMGPDGGSAEKPVGTVWIGIGNQKIIKALKFHFRFDRARNIEQTAQMALIQLFRFVQEQEGKSVD